MDSKMYNDLELSFCLNAKMCLFMSTARKESAKEKQLKEEQKILQSVAEGRGERCYCTH